MGRESGVVIGFDYGSRKIGVAVGHRATGTAAPLRTLPAVNQHPDWEAIGELIASWQPDEIIVGMPYNMDGSEAELAPRVRRFARQLEGRFNRPVHLIDERLTTVDATEMLIRRGARRRNGLLDAVAAKLILETWFSTNPDESRGN